MFIARFQLDRQLRLNSFLSALFPIPIFLFCPALNLPNSFSKQSIGIPGIFFEFLMRVVILTSGSSLLREAIHVELSDEGVELLVPEVLWQHFAGELLAVMDYETCPIFMPGNNVLIFFILCEDMRTSRMLNVFYKKPDFLHLFSALSFIIFGFWQKYQSQQTLNLNVSRNVQVLQFYNIMRRLQNLGYNFAIGLPKAVPRRLMDRQPKRQTIITPEERKIQYNPFQALKLIRLHSFTSFTESIDLCIQLGVNPKHGEQIVRGSAFMPAGLGKKTRVAVLCGSDQYEMLKEKGVDIFIDEEQIKKISSGVTEFDMLFTTPDKIGLLKAFGKVLGPRGLMPNAKIGTLVSEKNLSEAIAQAKAGQVNFRVDTGKNIHCSLGKITFSDEQILRNFKSLMQALIDKKPQGLKGKYLIAAFIKSTMGPRWRLNIEEIDPRSHKCMWDLIE